MRRDLNAAQTAGAGGPVRTGPVELEFEVAVTRTGGGQAGVQLWVLTLGGKAELAQANTQRIKVTLQPVDQTPARTRRSPTSAGGRGCGPPP